MGIKFFRDPYINGLTLGTFGGYVAFCITDESSLKVLEYAFQLPDKSTGGFIFHYQTLLSAVVAFIGATFVLLTHRDSIERKADAARSLASLAFSNIAGYARDCYFLIDGQDGADHMPKISSSDIEILSKFNEYGSKNDRERLQSFINQLQIYKVRLEGYLEETHNVMRINRTDSMVYDTIKLYHQAIIFLAYTRDGKAFASFSKEDLCRSAINMTQAIFSNDFDQISREMKRIIDRFYPG